MDKKIHTILYFLIKSTVACGKYNGISANPQSSPAEQKQPTNHTPCQRHNPAGKTHNHYKRPPDNVISTSSNYRPKQCSEYVNMLNINDLCKFLSHCFSAYSSDFHFISCSDTSHIIVYDNVIVVTATAVAIG